MKISKWTKMLLSTGIVSLPAVMLADSAPQPATVLTALSSTTLSGYVDTTAVWKFGTGDANLPGRVYDGPDVQDGFNLNVVSLTLDKPLDKTDWSAGYHVQMLMGPGAAKRGTGIIENPNTDFAFNEAYVNLNVPIGNGLEVHVGQFGTFNGYEAYDSYKDPNWSRSYGFFDETSAHTGVAAFYNFTSWLTVQAGVGNTGPFNSQVDAKAQTESAKAYLGMITLTAPDSWGWMKGATLSAGALNGPNVEFNRHVTQLYIGGTMPLPVTGLSLGVAYDYDSNINQFIADANVSGGYAHAEALYILWQATDKLKINTRLDHTGASPGWYYPVGDEDPNTDNTGSQQLGSLTVTADYALWKNVDSRVEFRWDRALDGSHPYGGTVAGEPDQKNALSLALNIIYMF